MTRRLLNLVTAVSLLLCVAVIALRARSYSAADGVTLASGAHTVPDGRVFMPGVQLISFRGYLNVHGNPRLEIDTVGWRRQRGGRVWISVGAADWVLAKPWMDDTVALIWQEIRFFSHLRGVTERK